MTLIHKILGLALAVYVLVMGLSGTILVFREPIQASLHPEFASGPAPDFLASPDKALENVRARYPAWLPLSLTWPHEHTPFWMVYLLKGPQGLAVYVDTRSGAIVGAHDPKSDWLGTVETIHSNWSFGRNGRLFNGYGALGTILLSLSGFWLVWPRLRHLRLSSQLLRARDLHYSLGALSLFFLLGISFTGAYFTWSKYYLDFAKSYLGRTPEIQLAPLSQPTPPQTLPISDLIARAQAALPGKPIQRIPIPNARYPYRVVFREGPFSAFHLVSSVTLDPRNGQVLLVQALADRPRGDAFLGWISAFHFGAFGGWPVQWLWAAFGVIMSVLAVSGVQIWWRSRPRRP